MAQSGSKKTKKAIRIRGGKTVTIGFFLILFVGSIVMVYISDMVKPDLNTDIPLVNSERYSIWNGSSYVLWMSNVVNASSNMADRLYFWVNTSEYNYTSYVVFKYYNKTHGMHYNASEPIADRFWNYRQWWTDYNIYTREFFNATVPSEAAFTIPRQEGGTEVVYQLTVAVWNGTGLEYNDYNGTYVVRFSDAEVFYEQKVHVTTGLYWASLPILSGLIFVAWRIYKPEMESTIKPEQRKNKHHLDEHLLIARSNHLDSTIGGLRTGAAVLLGIGTGATLWLSSISPLYQGYLGLGLVIFGLCSFTAIILTFSTSIVDKDGFKLTRGLIPSGQNLNEYKSHIKELIEKKEEVIDRIEGVIGAGLIYLATFIIMGIIVGFFPATDILWDRIWSMFPVWMALGLAFVDGLAWSAVVLGPRGLGLLKD
jgi:hypothetical protein